MANKAQVDVTERRIRPVYEQMDMGKFKKAAAECDRLLKKQPDFNCAFALKALCHIRMNRREEAETIITMLSERLPLDEHTLQALAYCFRDLQQPERTVQLYESAHKAKPDNEELLGNSAQTLT